MGRSRRQSLSLSLLLQLLYCPILLPVVAYELQRLSILRPWKQQQQHQQQHDHPVDSDAAAVLGWTVETRNGDAKTYRVRVGWNAANSQQPTGDGKEQLLRRVLADGVDDRGGDSSVVVDLPYYERDESLASSLWPGSLACSILCLSPAMSVAIEGARVLELGSGLGLTGLVAASRRAADCRLTDADDGVLEDVARLLRSSSNANGDGTGATTVRVDRLDWRDERPAVPPEQQADVVVSSDVAYYHYLVRPLMDAARKHFRSESTSLWLCVGQSNREAQWQLYRNVRDGCYNQLTDRHEPPWPGSARVLLYRLEMYEWRRDPSSHPVSASPTSLAIDGVLPIAALLYDDSTRDSYRRLSEWDHVATPEDEASLDMSF